MDLSEYDGKQFALLLCGETDDGEDDWAVFPGVARVRHGALFLERHGDKPDIEILPEWQDRIRPTNDKTKQILQGASYYVSLTVGKKPDEKDAGYVPTGLQWPE